MTYKHCTTQVYSRFVTSSHGLKTWSLTNAIMLLLVVTEKITLCRCYLWQMDFKKIVFKFWKNFWNKMLICLNPDQQIVIFCYCPCRKTTDLTPGRNICTRFCAKNGWSFSTFSDDSVAKFLSFFHLYKHHEYLWGNLILTSFLSQQPQSIIQSGEARMWGKSGKFKW